MWFCSLCYRPRKFVLAAKFATMHGLEVGDICLTCLREKAEEDIGMEKYDALNIGYTQAVLDEGSMPLMLCPHCNKWRATLLGLIPKANVICPSCIEVLIYHGQR